MADWRLNGEQQALKKLEEEQARTMLLRGENKDLSEDLEAAESRCRRLEEALSQLIVGVGMQQDGLGSLLGSFPEQMASNVRTCVATSDTALGRLIELGRTALEAEQEESDE